MICLWVQARLLLYLTKEIGMKDAARIISHLESCDHCAQILEAIAESHLPLKEAIQTTENPSATLDAAILARVQASQPPRPVPYLPQDPTKRVRLAFASLGAGILVSIGFLWGRQGRASSPPPLRPIKTLDLAGLTEAHRVWKPQTDPKHLDKIALHRNLSRQLGRRVIPLDMKANSPQLLSGKVVQIQQAPVATLHYSWKGKRITLAQADDSQLAIPEAPRILQHETRCFMVQQSGNLTYVFWGEGENNFVLLAELPAQTLFVLACQFCEQMEAI